MASDREPCLRQSRPQSPATLGGDIGNALVSAFTSAKNAVGEFVKTGKLDFRDLVTWMIADLAKLVARRFILAGDWHTGQVTLGIRHAAAPARHARQFWFKWGPELEIAFRQLSGSYMNSRSSCAHRQPTAIRRAHSTASSRVGNSSTVNPPLSLLPG